MRRISLLILVLSLVLSACGSDSKSSSTTTTTAPTTTTALPSASEDQAKAKAVVLTQADVGTGYKPAKKEVDEETSAEAEAAFKECSQNNPFLNSESEDRSAESEFEKDEFTSVSSEVEFWTSEADVKAAFDIISAEPFATCLNGAFTKVFAALGGAESEVEITDVNTVKKTATAAGSDQASALQTSLTISGGPIRVKLFLDMVFVRKGRAAAMLLTSSAQQAFPPSEEERLTAVLAQRLVANAG